MPLTTRLNAWLLQRRDQRRGTASTHALHRALSDPSLLTDPAHPLAETIAQAVRDGANLMQAMVLPGSEERITPLQLAVQADAWWLQRTLLAAFSPEHPAPAALFHVGVTLARVVPDGTVMTRSSASPSTVPSTDFPAPSTPADAPDPTRRVPLFAVALLRAQEALLSEREDREPVAAVTAWLDAGADPTLVIDGITLLQQLPRHDASFAQWPVDVLKRLGVHVVGGQGLGVLHTLWDEDAHAESVQGFVALLAAGADPYRPDDHGNGPLHHLAQGLAEGTVKPLVMKRLLEQCPDLDWLRPNAAGDNLVSIVRNVAHRVDAPARAKASLHAMAPLVIELERAELEAALFEARPSPRGTAERSRL